MINEFSELKLGAELLILLEDKATIDEISKWADETFLNNVRFINKKLKLYYIAYPHCLLEKNSNIQKNNSIK